MSDTDDIEATPPADDTPTAPDTGQKADVASSPGNVTSGIAWLALLLSVVALTAVSYAIYDDWRMQKDLELSSGNIENSIINLDGRIDAARESLQAIEESLAALAAADSVAANDLDQLERRLDDRLRQLEALPLRLASAEASIATLQGVSTGARESWLLGEAEYYMQLANAQLQLAGNPELAARALRMADERFAKLANPALVNVRAAIADELQALDGLRTPDVESISLTLSSLARVVDTLPLRPVERVAADDTAGDDAETGRLDRAWNAVKRAASGMIRYRSVDESVTPLISPQAEYFLRTNLTLQLQTARLALLRGEQGVFDESLVDAAAWLERYFDTGSTPVDNALQTIEDVRGGMFAVSPPDISRSLRLLRQYNAVSGSAQ